MTKTAALYHYLPCFLLLTFALSAACLKSPSAPAAQEPASITLSSYSIVLTSIDQRVRINATVLDQDSKLIANATIFFRSGNANVATVTDRGLVTAVTKGTTQIAVTSGYTTATVTVEQKAGSVEVTPSGSILRSVGQNAQFNAVVYDTGGSAIPGAVFVWSSSAPGVATVDSNGLVTAVSDGTTQITATSSGFMASHSVHVMIPRLAASIELDVSEATLTSVGQTVQLHAFVFDGEGVAIPSASVFWSSSHPLVATVNDSGLIIAVSNGITRIKANTSRRSISAYATISVLVGGTISPDKPPDKDALIAIYIATDGPNWANNTNWLSDELIAEWYGVATDNNLYVSGLSLPRNNLTGTIPPEIGQLQELRSLHLSENRLTGSIPPEIGQLGNLSYLNLFVNELTGEIPPELLQLHSLQSLDLGRNELTGEIPSDIDQLVNLLGLSLSSNQLTGEIPPRIGNLTKLQGLRLYSNQLTGEIPPRIGNLHELRYLQLSGNQLTGKIPRQIGNLSNLQRLWLSGNQLSGALPSEIGLLVKLVDLYLSYNENLSGPIPVRLTALTNLRTLTLTETQLCVPSLAAFRAWLDGIETKWGVKFCEE